MQHLRRCCLRTLNVLVEKVEIPYKSADAGNAWIQMQTQLTLFVRY